MRNQDESPQDSPRNAMETQFGFYPWDCEQQANKQTPQHLGKRFVAIRSPSPWESLLHLSIQEDSPRDAESTEHSQRSYVKTPPSLNLKMNQTLSYHTGPPNWCPVSSPIANLIQHIKNSNLQFNYLKSKSLCEWDCLLFCSEWLQTNFSNSTMAHSKTFLCWEWESDMNDVLPNSSLKPWESFNHPGTAFPPFSKGAPPSELRINMLSVAAHGICSRAFLSARPARQTPKVENSVTGLLKSQQQQLVDLSEF